MRYLLFVERRKEFFIQRLASITTASYTMALTGIASKKISDAFKGLSRFFYDYKDWDYLACD